MTGLMNWAEVAARLRDWAPLLANHLWQSTAFAVMAAGLALALKKNQARARYWIWMTASAKLLLPFALLAGIASHFVKPRAAAAPANAPIYFEVEDLSEPFGGAVDVAPARAANGLAVIAAESKTVVKPAAAQSGSAQESVSLGLVRRVVPAIPLVCGVVWLSGFVAVLAVWCVRWRRVARAMREASLLQDGREVNVLRRTEAAAGLKQHIELRLSTGAMEPGVFGILRPVLAWPAGISERLDDAHLEAVMAHEVCHVRRRDNLTAMIHMLVEATFWFHPVVWWVGARLVEERERACDEEVLAFCAHPQAYAESILKVCEFCVQTPAECVAGVTGADLKKRVAEIMTERAARKLTLGKKLLLLAAAMSVAAVPILLGQAQAARRLEAMITLAPRPVRALLATAGIQADSKRGEANPQAAVDAKAPEFEVASIRPGGTDPVMMRVQMAQGRLTVNASSLKGLVAYAFGVRAGSITGGADWVESELFDISAKIDDKEAAALAALPQKEQSKQYKAMVGQLLVERFKLKVRRETKKSPSYQLVVAKGGTKLVTSPPLVPDADGVMPRDGSATTTMLDGRHIVKRMTMQGLAATLSDDPEIRREVVDATGLKGPFDFEYTWKPSQDGSGTSLFTALEEQLGLKLVPAKAAVETLKIESAQKPSVDGANRMNNSMQLAELHYPGSSPADPRQDGMKPAYRLAAQEPVAPQPQQFFHYPQATLSSRGSKTNGPGLIDLPQPGFAAEITLAVHGTSDWLQSVQVINRSKQTIMSLRMGWAYVQPSGEIEFHQGDAVTVKGGGGATTNFPVPSQFVPVRPQAKYFLSFVEQVTLKDGTVVNANHDAIRATYKDIIESRLAAKTRTVIDPNSTVAQQGGLPPHLTPGLRPITFDVVSFRRTLQPGSPRVDLPVEGDYIAYHGVAIERLILFAHIARKGYVSITNEPDWAKTDLYDFTAKVAPEDVAEWKQMTLTDKRAMVAKLLADVLKLKVHQDTAPHPVYNLVTKGAPKLTHYQPGDTVTAPGGQVLTGKVLAWFDPFTMVCQDTTIAELVNSLSGPNRMGRIVVDKTGLSGAYNFTVPILYGPLPQQVQEVTDVASTYEGLRQLGLQLVKSTGVTDTIVVDHLERPQEN